MVKLIDGKGQLGEALKKAEIKSDWTIYHTWNFIDKEDEEIQRKCFLDFIDYVVKHPNQKICFISTSSINSNTSYKKYKRLAEIYLQGFSEHKIIRFCGIIGKGVCQDFRENKIKPYREMKLISLKKAIELIISFLQSEDKDRTIYGYEIPADIVNELIQFGKNGKTTE